MMDVRLRASYTLRWPRLWPCGRVRLLVIALAPLSSVWLCHESTGLSVDPDAWDCDGLLKPQVFAMNGTYDMIYADLKGSGWNRVSAMQTGLAVAGV